MRWIWGSQKGVLEGACQDNGCQPRAPHRNQPGGKKRGAKTTYNTRDSLVVADPTTGLALTCLSRAERTGC
ncbi:hypothetical protein B0T17DRAFT_312544 [Bombardia bombarda]|uniref:Uncharacterized protein n=1 Tax=Bombardia bombarda TaxID=252184 RepID=A0AA39WM23_9PEZI|nr:hypothetical protein B0T17DRAFT_312544 [Bombardia bombarda]